MQLIGLSVSLIHQLNSGLLSSDALITSLHHWLWSCSTKSKCQLSWKAHWRQLLLEVVSDISWSLARAHVYMNTTVLSVINWLLLSVYCIFVITLLLRLLTV